MVNGVLIWKGNMRVKGFGLNHSGVVTRLIQDTKKAENLYRSSAPFGPVVGGALAGPYIVNVLVTGGMITSTTPPAGTGNVSEQNYYPGKFTTRNAESTSSSDKWMDDAEICLVMPMNQEAPASELLVSGSRYAGRVVGTRNGKAVVMVMVSTPSADADEITMSWINNICDVIDTGAGHTGFITDLYVSTRTQTKLLKKTISPAKTSTCIRDPGNCCTPGPMFYGDELMASLSEEPTPLPRDHPSYEIVRQVARNDPRYNVYLQPEDRDREEPEKPQPPPQAAPAPASPTAIGKTDEGEERAVLAVRLPIVAECPNRGDVLTHVECLTCAGSQKYKVYSCSAHKEGCTVGCCISGFFVCDGREAK